MHDRRCESIGINTQRRERVLRLQGYRIGTFAMIGAMWIMMWRRCMSFSPQDVV